MGTGGRLDDHNTTCSTQQTCPQEQLQASNLMNHKFPIGSNKEGVWGTAEVLSPTMGFEIATLVAQNPKLKYFCLWSTAGLILGLRNWGNVGNYGVSWESYHPHKVCHGRFHMLNATSKRKGAWAGQKANGRRSWAASQILAGAHCNSQTTRADVPIWKILEPQSACYAVTLRPLYLLLG